jgi:hypothetical protein
VADFLSEAWFDAFARALDAVAVGTANPLRLAHHVDTPDGTVTWVLAFHAEGVEMQRDAGEADVTLHLDLATATALARGTLAPRAALADGLLTVVGSPARLLEGLEAFGAVTDATAALRAETTFGA